MDEQKLVNEVKKVRHFLHQYPELSNEEYQTSQFINDYLSKLGYRIITPQGLKTGVIAEIGPESSDIVIGLRSDIDALPISEKTDLPFSSTKPGVMHACGHDFHMASLLGAAQLLGENQEELSVRIRLIFQPAEESHTGAQAVTEAGGVDDLNAIIGFHNKPDLKANEISILSGGQMAAVDQFKVVFTGKGTHAAMPHLGNDPIIALTNTVNALQTIISRNIKAQNQVVISVTHIEGGSTWNVTPNDAWFEGTIRTFDSASREVAKKRFYQIVQGQSQSFDLQVEIEWDEGPDVVKNDQTLSTILIDEAKEHSHFITAEPSNAGEDFSYFSQRIPSVFAFIGSDGNTDWHHDDLILNDEGLLPASYWYFYSAKRLAKYFEKA